MASSGKHGGQRNDLSSASGRKERSPTATTNKGSRVEPSHTHEQVRDDRAKAAAKKVAKKAAKKK